MAHSLIEMLQAPFEPAEYHDEYRAALMARITAKLEGGEIVAAEEQAPAAQPVDLMAALRASIEATQKRKAPAGGSGNGRAAASDGADEPAAKQPAAKKKPAARKSRAAS